MDTSEVENHGTTNWYDEVVNSVRWKGPHEQKPFQGPGPEDHRLYTVTTISRSARFGGERTPVICRTFDRAKAIVEKNEGDIWEYSYMLCVIEAVDPDYLYSASYLNERYWYCWNLKYSRYLPIETPEHYEGVFGFGVG